jgi:hypothetical protein
MASVNMAHVSPGSRCTLCIRPGHCIEGAWIKILPNMGFVVKYSAKAYLAPVDFKAQASREILIPA